MSNVGLIKSIKAKRQNRFIERNVTKDNRIRSKKAPFSAFNREPCSNIVHNPVKSKKKKYNYYLHRLFIGDKVNFLTNLCKFSFAGVLLKLFLSSNYYFLTFCCTRI